MSKITQRKRILGMRKNMLVGMKIHTPSSYDYAQRTVIMLEFQGPKGQTIYLSPGTNKLLCLTVTPHSSLYLSLSILRIPIRHRWPMLSS